MKHINLCKIVMILLFTLVSTGKAQAALPSNHDREIMLAQKFLTYEHRRDQNDNENGTWLWDADWVVDYAHKHNLLKGVIYVNVDYCDRSMYGTGMLDQSNMWAREYRNCRIEPYYVDMFVPDRETGIDIKCQWYFSGETKGQEVWFETGRYYPNRQEEPKIIDADRDDPDLPRMQTLCDNGFSEYLRAAYAERQEVINWNNEYSLK